MNRCVSSSCNRCACRKARHIVQLGLVAERLGMNGTRFGERWRLFLFEEGPDWDDSTIGMIDITESTGPAEALVTARAWVEQYAGGNGLELVDAVDLNRLYPEDEQATNALGLVRLRRLP